jgi:hypothetical protein
MNNDIVKFVFVLQCNFYCTWFRLIYPRQTSPQCYILYNGSTMNPIYVNNLYGCIMGLGPTMEVHDLGDSIELQDDIRTIFHFVIKQ